MPRGPSLAGLVLIAVLATSATCASRPAPGPPVAAEPPAGRAGVPGAERTATATASAHDESCALLPAAGEPIGVVGLTEAVDPSRAPGHTNDSERLVFGQLYDTLVRVDCEGRLQPGLAAAWTRDAANGAWTFSLHDEARYSDGTRVTAAAIEAAWTRGSTDGTLTSEVRRYVESISIVDEGRVAIRLRDDTPEPRALAQPSLAIVKDVAGSAWPLGTRGLVVQSAERAIANGTQGIITLVPGAGADPARLSVVAPLRFVISSGRDPRDFLDEGIDLLVTRDASALDYAASLPQFDALPLPWNRTYVFLSPARPLTAEALSENARRALAEDAVRGEARPAAGPSWLEGAGTCESPASAPALEPASDRIVYVRGDDAGRDLAERLVGLAGARTSEADGIVGPLLPPSVGLSVRRAVGLDPGAWLTSARRGADAAYIVRLEREPLAPCASWRELIDRFPWISAERAVPLVETRLRAIVRTGHAGLAATHDGIVMLTGARDAR